MWTLLTILFVIISETLSETEVCGLQKSVQLVNRTYEGLTFGKNEIILDPKTKEERGCVCLKRNCAGKCCPFGLAYKHDSKKCIKTNTTFAPPVTEGFYPRYIYKEGFNATKEFIFMTGKMVCVREKNERRLPVWPAVRSFNLTMDGDLYVGMTRDMLIYGPDKYCIDIFVADDEKPHLNALICYVPQSDLTVIEIITRCTCLLIFCFFTLPTIAVYSWLPELRNVPGMVLMAYLLSFFVGFLIEATMLILILNAQITPEICTTLTFIIYFSLLAAFFWLNVMCYDTWRTFSGKRVHVRSGSPRKWFTYYAVYAFGVPTILTVILASLEFSGQPMQHPLLPKVRQRCSLSGNAKLLYLSVPVVILSIANLTFFGLTASKIWKTNKETKVLRGKDCSTHDLDKTDTQSFSLYVKLFTVMGINWLIESSIFVFSYFYPNADFPWNFNNAYYALVGPIIFIIFVCKKKTWRMIKRVCSSDQIKNQEIALRTIQ